MYVVITTLRAYGPFDTADRAAAWALGSLPLTMLTIEIKELHKPSTYFDQQTMIISDTL